MLKSNILLTSRSVVSSVISHPSENIIGVCGLDRKLKLFKLNSHKESTEIISVYLPDLPIYSACFTSDGNQIILTGNRKFFYYYDLEKQKVEPI